jgi:hypothetical protein
MTQAKRVRSTLSWSISAFLFMVTVSPRLLSQGPWEPAAGLNPYGIYQAGEIDQVGLSSHRLNLHIPLLVDHSQRGNLNFTYSLTYSSNSWLEVVPLKNGESPFWTGASSACGHNGESALAAGPQTGTVRLTTDGNPVAALWTTENDTAQTVQYAGVTEDDGFCHPLGQVSGSSDLEGAGWVGLSISSGHHYTRPFNSDRQRRSTVHYSFWFRRCDPNSGPKRKSDDSLGVHNAY